MIKKTRIRPWAVLVVLLCMMSGSVFTGCSSDDDTPASDANKAVAFKFSLLFADSEEAVDQPDLITTTYSFINHRGEKESGTFNDEFVEEFGLKSQEYTTLPGEVEFVILETLNPDAERTKNAYSTGLKLVLQATSYTKDGDVVDTETKALDTHLTIPAANLDKVYPKTTRLKFKVEKDGTVTM